MRIARFNHDRLGLILDDEILDVSAALEALPAVRWPYPPGDPLIVHLDAVMAAIGDVRARAKRMPLSEARLDSPITWPSKVVAAPANYRAHLELDTQDPGVDQGVHRASVEGVEKPTYKLGPFLKATSSVVGAAQGVVIGQPGRRCDHEVEIVAVIGRTARNVSRASALSYVAGYTIGLDMTYRGVEDRSFRKSADTFTVLGPCLATADEIRDPDDMKFWLSVNGKERQRSSTAHITVGVAELIELASSMYTLLPGDVIMTGTPEGVGPVTAGDVIHVGAEGIGDMTLQVSPGPASAASHV